MSNKGNKGSILNAYPQNIKTAHETELNVKLVETQLDLIVLWRYDNPQAIQQVLVMSIAIGIQGPNLTLWFYNQSATLCFTSYKH